MINNPYQTAPMMNNYVPQYGAYQYNPMANMQRCQPQEQMLPTQMSGTPQQQIAGLNGRVIQTAENINANEVPMDGSMAFFPKQDLSEIYVKGWDANGLIKTVVYKPYTDVNSGNAVNSMPNTEKLKIDLSEKATEGIMNKFDELFGKIEQLEERVDKSLGSQRKSSRTQSKESDTE